jgi:hypothetical protein
LLHLFRLSKADKRIGPQNSVSSFLPSTSNGIIRTKLRPAAAAACLRQHSVSFRCDSPSVSDWPVSAASAAAVRDEAAAREGGCSEDEEVEESVVRHLTSPASSDQHCTTTRAAVTDDGGGGGAVWTEAADSGGQLSFTSQHRSHRRRRSSSVFRLAQSFSIINLIETTREVLV